MRKKEKPSTKTTIHDFFIKIVDALNLRDMPRYEKLNLLLSVLLAAVALALSLPPVLALVNNIVISIGNIIIAALGKPEYIQESNSSVTLTVILPLLIVFIEIILCMVLCGFYKKINGTSTDK